MRQKPSNRDYSSHFAAREPFDDSKGLYQLLDLCNAHLHFTGEQKKDGMKPDYGVLRKRWECCWDYAELMERRNWLLWRNTQFQKDFRKLQKETGVEYDDTVVFRYADDRKDVVTHRRVQTVSMLKPFATSVFLPLPLGRKFLARYKIPHFAVSENIKSDLEVQASFDMMLDLAYLKGLANRDGWGFEAGNFERDREWYELHMEWQTQGTEDRMLPAESFVYAEAESRGQELTEKERAKRIAKLLAKSRLPMKHVLSWTEANLCHEIDRMVLHSIQKKHDELLRKIGESATRRPSDDRSKKLRDYEILHHLGVFLKARANRGWMRSQEISPAYSIDGGIIDDGNECYLRFDYDASLVEGDSPWFKLLEPRDDPRKRLLREKFLKRRKDYLVKSDSPFAGVVKQAINEMREKIKKVIDFS